MRPKRAKRLHPRVVAVGLGQGVVLLEIGPERFVLFWRVLEGLLGRGGRFWSGRSVARGRPRRVLLVYVSPKILVKIYQNRVHAAVHGRFWLDLRVR